MDVPGSPGIVGAVKFGTGIAEKVHNVVDVIFEKGAVPGFLTGRRPGSGQLFPRGVYNK